MFTAFLTAFASVFIAELGDKTQLVTLSLSSRFPPVHVLGGAMLALVILISLAVGLGNVIYNYVPLEIISLVSGFFFIIMGVWIYLQPAEKPRQKELSKSGFNQAFVITLLAEMGDKTQMAVLLLAASLGAPLAVLLGAILAMLLIHSISVFLGSRFLVKLPQRVLKVGAALLFIVIGLLVIIIGPE